jgi:hypothetical protein
LPPVRGGSGGGTHERSVITALHLWRRFGGAVLACPQEKKRKNSGSGPAAQGAVGDVESAREGPEAGPNPV